MNRSWDADNNDGGADPNEAVEFGSLLGSYEFSNLEDFALGEYNQFSQTSGNPTFSFAVPYYGFYVQDSFRALPNLTLDMGLREDFQVYPQPAENPAFPLTGQYPNQFRRLAPRFGFAWEPVSKTVVRGGSVSYTHLDVYKRQILSIRGVLRVGTADLEPRSTAPPKSESGKAPARRRVSVLKREQVVQALKEADGQVGGSDGAAARLGLKRTTLIAHMKKLGINPRTRCV